MATALRGVALAILCHLLLGGVFAKRISTHDQVSRHRDADQMARAEPKVKQQMTVLWPHLLPKPAAALSLAPDFDMVWAGEDGSPDIAADAKVSIFYLTKYIGRHVADIWHGAIGFRVEGGPTFAFEFSPFEMIPAIAFPDQMATKEQAAGTSDVLLQWPSATYVAFYPDPSGKSFGGGFTNSQEIGESTGAGVSAFFSWALGFAVSHPRYVGWRVLESETEQPLLESLNCFDFAHDALRFLKGTGIGKITATHFKTTVLNMYASSIQTVEYSPAVAATFTSKAEVVGEMLALAGLFDPSFDTHHRLDLQALRWVQWQDKTVLYFPAWYSLTPYAGGTSSILQNTDAPRMYHKYELAWPEKSKTAAGVQTYDAQLF